MLELLKSDLKIRTNDINQLLDLLTELSKAEHQKNNELLFNIIGSSLILAVYNQIEFLLREVLLEIYSEIRSAEISYFNLQSEIQNELIKMAKKSGSKDVFEKILNNTFLQYEPNDKELFNGNIDDKVLKTTLKTYAITVPKIFHRSQIDLDTLKTQRNKLAHGEIAFSDSAYLLTDFTNLVSYTNELVLNILDYLEICINERKYLLQNL